MRIDKEDKIKLCKHFFVLFDHIIKSVNYFGKYHRMIHINGLIFFPIMCFCFFNYGDKFYALDIILALLSVFSFLFFMLYFSLFVKTLERYMLYFDGIKNFNYGVNDFNNSKWNFEYDDDFMEVIYFSPFPSIKYHLPNI